MKEVMTMQNYKVIKNYNNSLIILRINFNCEHHGDFTYILILSDSNYIGNFICYFVTFVLFLSSYGLLFLYSLNYIIKTISQQKGIKLPTINGILFIKSALFAL